MLAVDTETTGKDFYHGAMPYLVTICDGEKPPSHWEWFVDPLTRRPIIPKGDLFEVSLLLTGGGDERVLQNAKFDITALQTLGNGIGDRWPWERTRDTLSAAHLLASNRPKGLGELSIQYLGHDIQPYEDALEVACHEARRLARKQFPTWRIAKHGLPDMPSVKKSSKAKEDRAWKIDAWLPRAIARELNYPDDHPWWRVLADYADADSEVTAALWPEMEAELHRRDLWEIYLQKLKELPVAYAMESYGITYSGKRLEEQKGIYRAESQRTKRLLTAIAADYGHELVLPKGAVNNNLRTFCFDVLKLEPQYDPKGKGVNPCLDAKIAIPFYLATLPPTGKPYLFIKKLTEVRSRDVAVTYMEGYERFARPWVPVGGVDPITGAGWYILHPSLNPTGSATLRWSSSNPNEQNISKKESFNIRYCFGPAPGREWWSLDAKNIELRIPAYEAGEEEMIALFERPDEAPYYGSNHLLVSHILHPRLFEACRNERGEVDGRIFKKKYAATWYQWVKNGNFAVQYGAIESSGTADRAYHVPNAQRRIQERFSRIARLNRKMIDMAEKYGYVETIPDKTVNPNQGYPLLCTRSEYGKILPTVPLNYHVQGTAMWWMGKAMTRCHEVLLDWQRQGFDGHLIMQVHDELVFDFPRRGDPVVDSMKREKNLFRRMTQDSNLWRVRTLQGLMAMGGDDIGIPTPVSCEYHPENWSEGVTL